MNHLVFGSLLLLKLLLRLGVVVSVVVVEVGPPRAELVRDEPEGAGVSALAADGLVVVPPVRVAALHANAEASSEVVVSANVADPAGVDILRHVVAIIGRVPLEPLGIDLALVKEGVIAERADSSQTTGTGTEIPG